MPGRGLSGGRGTVVDLVEGVFEFAHEDGVTAAELSFDIWEYFREVVDNRDSYLHCDRRNLI